MSKQSRINQVLESMLESRATPEEACRDCPELLPLVKRRWAHLNGVEHRLDAMFPATFSVEISRTEQHPGHRPEIPGYSVGEVLGRGAVGVVYKATHLKLQRDVALKMLLSGDYASETERKRFKREAQTVASIKHPNFVHVYAVGDFKGCPYFTMELVEGGSLAQLLAGVPLASGKSAGLLIVIADAMHAAHLGGIIHRDLKPSNILLTPDGTPKVGDFGLARPIGTDSDLTRSGDRVGTPCYMAPEQAKGRLNAIGPLADVYSLGAILYEMLTGRPPFQGETPGETERQLLSLDPVPPSRMNPKVPRDLETICLKCLQKDIHRRYGSAADLAEDLRRFKRGESVLARRVGPGERTMKWVRRHPSATVAILGTALFLFTLTGWFFWAIAERTAARRAINDDLQEVIQDERRGAWADAKLCQERVKARLNRNTPAELRRQSQQNDADLTMVGRLDSIRLARSPRLLHEINDMAFRDEYRAAFADAGYGSPDDAPELVASRINTSNIKPALLAAIYDWTASGDDKRLVNWLSAIMAGSDPTPHPWIIRARKKIFTGNKSELIALLLDAPTDRTCVRLADTLALRLQDLGGDGISFLKRTFRTHPDDFWTAFDLGMCCAKARQWADSMIYRQVALALRPGDAGIASQIGIALYETDHKEEALEQMKHAADLDSNCWEAQCNFANCLCDLGHFREAISVFEHCFQLPHAPFADASARYSICLDATGQPQAGCARLIEAINIKPSVILTGLAKSSFIDEGYAEQIRTAWGQAIAKRSFDPPDSDGYQDFCAFLGREDEFRTASSKVLSHSGETDNPQLRGDIARGALLLPTDGQRQQLAFDIIDNNLTLDKTKLPSWIPDHFQFNKALAEYRRGNWQNSITALRNGGARVLGPAELFIEAMSRSQLGETDKANRLFRQGVISINWNPSNANTRDSWIYHVLRREAETMLCRHLPDFVAGSYSPTTNEERIAFTGYCHANGLNLAASKLYSEVFSSDSSIEYSHQMDYRLKAARAAALAGCGIGKDSQRLSAAEKRKWRDQARTWLISDLASLTSTSNTTSGKAATNGQLCTWRTDRDLANVRDASKLQSLDSQERDQWSAFWVDVDSQINATIADQK